MKKPVLAYTCNDINFLIACMTEDNETITHQEVLDLFNKKFNSNIVITIDCLTEYEIHDLLDAEAIKKLYAKILYTSKHFNMNYIFEAVMVLINKHCSILNENSFTVTCAGGLTLTHNLPKHYVNNVIKANDFNNNKIEIKIPSFDDTLDITSVFTKKQKHLILEQYFISNQNKPLYIICLEIVYGVNLKEKNEYHYFHNKIVWFYLMFNNKKLNKDNELVQYFFNEERKNTVDCDLYFHAWEDTLLNGLDIMFYNNNTSSIMKNYKNRIKRNRLKTKYIAYSNNHIINNRLKHLKKYLVDSELDMFNVGIYMGNCLYSSRKKYLKRCEEEGCFIIHIKEDSLFKKSWMMLFDSDGILEETQIRFNEIYTDEDVSKILEHYLI